MAATPNDRSLPPSVDLRAKMPPVTDQGSLGSCSAHALCAVLGYQRSQFAPSPLFVYYNERLIEREVEEDSGALLADGVTSLRLYGACSETLCPYVVEDFAKPPSRECYVEALQHRIPSAHVLFGSAEAIKAELAAGTPVVVGISIYEHFESDECAKTGVVNMPDVLEASLGGHAVLLCGYDDASMRWIVRNSWGPSWGQAGYFTLPYQYLQLYGSEAYSLGQVS